MQVPTIFRIAVLLGTKAIKYEMDTNAPLATLLGSISSSLEIGMRIALQYPEYALAVCNESSKAVGSTNKEEQGAVEEIVTAFPVGG